MCRPRIEESASNQHQLPALPPRLSLVENLVQFIHELDFQGPGWLSTCWIVQPLLERFLVLRVLRNGVEGNVPHKWIRRVASGSILNSEGGRRTEAKFPKYLDEILYSK